MKELKQFDVVALTIDLPDEGLRRGQVGTIVEIYQAGESIEVDFVDHEGFSYALLTLHPEHLMPLHYEPLRQTV
ncbi:MAG: DUF4926 domain-containing protein [Acidobacteria bacterium]|nr:DUF4926 domain-containing protein [Acidobacteriota bacterium]